MDLESGVDFIISDVQEQMKEELSAVVAANGKKEREMQLKHSDALERERAKRDRIVSVDNDQHLLALDLLRRKLDKEWEKITSGLQKQLGAVQNELVQCELRQGRVAKRVKEKEETDLLLGLHLRNDLTVRACLLSLLELFYFMICIYILLLSLPLAKVEKQKVDKLEQKKRDANHKIKMLQQQLRRSLAVEPGSSSVVDLSEVPCEEDGTTDNDVRKELLLLQAQVRLEDERVSRLITGVGKGRGKSLEFEFAARTILATGCSARAARDQILVTGQLFLPASKFVLFEHEVPTERWFRYQRKGLGYEAWLYSMVRVAKCEAILQWGFDETRYNYYGNL